MEEGEVLKMDVENVMFVLKKEVVPWDPTKLQIAMEPVVPSVGRPYAPVYPKVNDV
jgi:hypothetical protein